MTVLGLLPAIRGGLGGLARTGQHTRLLQGYVRRYLQAFDEVRYFSYVPEALEDYTADAEILARTRLVPGSRRHPWLYTFLLPLRHRRTLEGCGVLRVFQVSGAVPAVIAHQLLGVPFVVTYGFWYARLARTPLTRVLGALVERVGLAAAEAVIVTTPELGRHVAARHPRARVHLVPNGVDTDLFVPGPPRKATVATVLYLGRLSEEKNVETLIDATEKLATRVALRLRIVGDGPRRAALAARAAERHVPVDFEHVVDHARVPGLLAGADVFVLPSFTEGHPKALLEAMSAGLPCVVSDIPGNRAVVTEGETGLLFDPGDPHALADRVEQVLADPELASALGTNARASARARFDLGVLVGREIEILRVAAERR